ncbi:fatty acid desaturase [Streptomyces sp. NPDC001941]|uniref:fatty acid desaturase n=1 Tax=Streptomyces sp. NPDC001941 TaxID=3154659 RepID=UPI003328BE6D
MSEVNSPRTPSAPAPVGTDPVRESMQVLPRALAGPLTLLTGRPYAGQRAPGLTPTRHLVNALVSVVLGVAASCAGLAVGGWCLLLLVPGWAMALHGARNLRMMIYHQCAHQNMWRKRRADELVGKLIAACLMIQDFDRYSAEHVGDHHALHHMTRRDPTVQAFLVTLELRPGMSRGRMWRRVLGKAVSPWFHARFLWARVRSYYAYATPAWRAGTTAGYALVAAVVTWQGLWPYALLAWLLPMTLFFQVSNVFRLCVKHSFPQPGQEPRRGKDYFASLTNAIFIGERAPSAELPFIARQLAWSRWWLRMALVHFPSRYLVLTGDTVVHDFHHRHPMSRDWADYVFAREADHVKGSPGWPAYHEVWGLVAAIDHVFDSLRTADPEEYDAGRLAEVNHRALFMAFED